MARRFTLILLLALAGCSSHPPYQASPSPCSAGEASYDCQIERYQNVNAD
jgi:uncharacterized lipoprotein YmbA